VIAHRLVFGRGFKSGERPSITVAFVLRLRIDGPS
jgi:hypothetical protein